MAEKERVALDVPPHTPPAAAATTAAVCGKVCGMLTSSPVPASCNHKLFAFRELKCQTLFSALQWPTNEGSKRGLVAPF